MDQNQNDKKVTKMTSTQKPPILQEKESLNNVQGGEIMPLDNSDQHDNSQDKPISSGDNDYYINDSMKTVDFLIGFFPGLFIVFFLSYFWFLTIPMSIIMSDYFKKRGRRYISKGILFSWILLLVAVLLVFGACFISVGNGSFKL